MSLFAISFSGAGGALRAAVIRLSLFLCALAGLAPAQATTLSRVSFDDLVQRSTGIVRGRIVGSYSDARGSLIYTYYKVQVQDRWKGAPAAQVEVQIPGGTFGGQQQNYLGTPQLTEGAEYVFFLWTGPSGANHLLGLSQGILDVTRNADGELVLKGQSTDALIMDSAGRNAAAEPLRMKLSDFGTRVSGALKAGAKAK
jgi:hypothetical protein